MPTVRVELMPTYAVELMHAPPFSHALAYPWLLY